MKLLFITHNWFGEGTSVRALQFARALVKRGHAVTLLATNPRPFSSARFQDHGVKVVLAPHFRDRHRGGWGWLDLPWRSLWALGQNFELVYAFDHKPNVVLPAWVQKVLKGTPLVSDWADWWSGPKGVNAAATGLKAWVEARSETRVRHLAGWVTAISPRLGKRALDLGLPAERVMVLHSGGRKPEGGLNPRLARKRFAFKPSEVVGLYLGVGNADLPMVYKALASARRKNKKLKLLVVGPDEERKRAMAAADFGMVPLASNLMNEARWPNKVGEYAVAGLPILSNPVGPLKRILKKEKAGILAGPSPEAMATAMLKLAGSASFRRSLSRAARAWARRDLDWDKLALRLETFFEQARRF